MISLDINSQNPWDNWVPTDKISFEKLKEKYPAIENGDLLLVPETTSSHRYWAFYKPGIGKNYDLYALGFSSDSTSIFFHNKKISNPIIIKSDNKNLITLLKKQLSNL